MKQSLSSKFQRLKHIIKDLDSVVLAYSGGVDSSFLLSVCSEILAKDVLAVTADSASFPKRELKEARAFARELKVPHLIIKTDELENEEYLKNPPNRCYYCKKELFSKLKEIKTRYNKRYIIDGSNLDDDADFRPGNKAKKEFFVRSPLREAYLRKDEIRDLCKKLSFSFWDKPSLACLASRIPYHSKIEPGKLRRIEKAENFLTSLGFRQVRVRDFGSLAKIEVDRSKIKELFASPQNRRVISFFKKLGFGHVAIDLEGYRTGSLNDGINRLKIEV